MKSVQSWVASLAVPAAMLVGTPTLALVSTAAQAAPIEFDFTGPSQTFPNTQSFNGSVAGTSVTAQAYALPPLSNWVTQNPLNAAQKAVIRRTATDTGIGVSKGWGPGNAQGTLDAEGEWLEGILFDFGTPSLASVTITFGAVTSLDRASVFWGNGPFDADRADDQLSYSLRNFVIRDEGTLVSSGVYEVEFSSMNYSQYLFVASADDGQTGTGQCGSLANPNCFYINSISNVPEPSSVALLGIAIAGMGLAGMRRRKN